MRLIDSKFNVKTEQKNSQEDIMAGMLWNNFYSNNYYADFYF